MSRIAVTEDPYRTGQVVGGRAVCAARSVRRVCDGKASCRFAQLARRCTAAAGDPCPCPQPPIKGRTRCYNHGGPTPRGPALPQWRHGKYGDAFAGTLMEAYERARTDPALIALDDELAAYNVILPVLLGRVRTGESAARWEAIREAYEAFMAAKDADNALAAKRAIELWGQLSAEGIADAKALRDWYEAVEGKRRISDTERKRLEAMQLFASKEELVATCSAFAMAVVEEEHDQRILARILARFELIIANPGGNGRGRAGDA